MNAVIDCTGGGHVLKLAGADAFQPPEGSDGRTFGGFAVRLAGLAGDPEMLRLQIPYALAKAVEAGSIARQRPIHRLLSRPRLKARASANLPSIRMRFPPAEADELAEKVVGF